MPIAVGNSVAEGSVMWSSSDDGRLSNHDYHESSRHFSEDVLAPEEKGIKHGNLGRMPAVELIVPKHQRIFKDGIQIMGNYREIYVLNIGALVLRSKLNHLYADPCASKRYQLLEF